MLLDREQCKGCDDRKDHDGDAGPGGFQRFGVEQAVDALQQHQYGRAGDEGRLCQASQRLGLAVAEAVFLVGGFECIANGEQVDDRGGGVHQRVDQAGQQAD